jgi:hypothetical protein
MTDARALARAAGAAQRAYGPVTLMVAASAVCGGTIALHGTAVIEALDLLRFYIREETLRGIIEPPMKWPGPIKRAVKRKAKR